MARLVATESADAVKRPFIGGSVLHAYHEMHPIQAPNMDTFGMSPGWGSQWKKFVHDNAARWCPSYIQTSSFPYENTLRLRAELRR